MSTYKYGDRLRAMRAETPSEYEGTKTRNARIGFAETACDTQVGTDVFGEPIELY